jgi:SAM-dependent methyltransferase
MTTPTIDNTQVEQFADKMTGVWVDAFVALATSVGHRTGLFDAMEGSPPSTSDEIAIAAGLHERYVREWLGAVTTAGIVDYDPEAKTYHLPPEHAAVLTRSAGEGNLARLFQYVPLMSRVEDQVVSSFRNGGGVPYSEFTDFHRVMAEDSGAIFDASLIDGILPLAEGLPRRLEEGIEVADIGCGRGRAVNLMARAYPDSRFVGYDFSEEAIAAARAEAEEFGLANARFELLDVATLDVTDGYDLITAFDAIHDQAHPAKVLSRVAAALRPDGVFLMVDILASSHLEENIDLPWAPFLYTVSFMHCMTVSLALGGTGLGTAWGQHQARGMLDDAGFSSVEVNEIPSDPFNYCYVATKG